MSCPAQEIHPAFLIQLKILKNIVFLQTRCSECSSLDRRDSKLDSTLLLYYQHDSSTELSTELYKPELSSMKPNWQMLGLIFSKTQNSSITKNLRGHVIRTVIGNQTVNAVIICKLPSDV
ncbi:hypothetical protein NP493_21g11030 [Ridgeia piscesae]|uniref:Uncharacterized protein n=1 Tax=Ridgeia piscesae TaxID=27915 RepID=A0AAD9PDX4_RIDPI|nr:hypothetical protein NP493_21g11030 [Ridgeia piscesae]